jgi:hypothetical protein
MRGVSDATNACLRSCGGITNAEMGEVTEQKCRRLKIIGAPGEISQCLVARRKIFKELIAEGADFGPELRRIVKRNKGLALSLREPQPAIIGRQVRRLDKMSWLNVAEHEFAARSRNGRYRAQCIHEGFARDILHGAQHGKEPAIVRPVPRSGKCLGDGLAAEIDRNEFEVLRNRDPKLLQPAALRSLRNRAVDLKN